MAGDLEKGKPEIGYWPTSKRGAEATPVFLRRTPTILTRIIEVLESASVN